MNKIKVSTCIITYNQKDFIRECIQGVLKQKGDFIHEIIIGDDCSSDGTDEVCLEYKIKYSNLISYHRREKNLGMISNWIKTLSECSGKYIALCEGDDYWTDPLKLQKQVDFLEANPTYVITYGKIQSFDVNGLIDKKYGAERDLTSEELIKCTGINTLSVCFRNVIKKFPKEMYCARIGDLFLWSLLGAYGNGKYLEEIEPSMYRLHEGGVFSLKDKKNRNEMWLNTSFALFTYYKRIGDTNYTNYFQEKYLSASIRLIGNKVLLKIVLKQLFFKIKLILKID